MPDEAEILRKLMRIRDWSIWAKDVCGFDATAQQAAVLKDLSRPGAKVSVASGHGVGKTCLASIAVLAMLDLYGDEREDVKVICTSPSASGLKDYLWKECSKWINHMSQEKQREYEWRSDTIVMTDYPTMRFATAKTSTKEKPEALQGGHADHVLFIVDEASGVPDAIFGPMEGALTGADCRVLLISNPTKASGYFHNSHHEDRARWKLHRFSCWDSPRVEKAFCESIKAAYGEDSNFYRIRVLGEFPQTEDDVLIPIEWITDSIGRNIAPEGECVAGLDVGSTGDDSALTIRRGHVVILCESWHLIETMDTAGKAAAYMKAKHCDTVNVDAQGIGAGVASRLKQLGFNVNCVMAQEVSPYKDRFNRLRDQLWWTAREFFESKVCSINEDVSAREKLIAELSSMHWELTASGKVQVEPKHKRKSITEDKYSERSNKLKKSPNCADSFNLSLLHSDILGLSTIEPESNFTPDTEPQGELANWAAES